MNKPTYQSMSLLDFDFMNSHRACINICNWPPVGQWPSLYIMKCCAMHFSFGNCYCSVFQSWRIRREMHAEHIFSPSMFEELWFINRNLCGANGVHDLSRIWTKECCILGISFLFGRYLCVDVWRLWSGAYSLVVNFQSTFNIALLCMYP